MSKRSTTVASEKGRLFILNENCHLKEARRPSQSIETIVEMEGHGQRLGSGSEVRVGVRYQGLGG